MQDYLYSTAELGSHIDVVEQGLFWRGSPLRLVVQSKPNGDLVVEDQRPDKAEDQLQVPVDNISTPCRKHHRAREMIVSGGSWQKMNHGQNDHRQ